MSIERSKSDDLYILTYDILRNIRTNKDDKYIMNECKKFMDKYHMEYNDKNYQMLITNIVNMSYFIYYIESLE